MKIRFTQDFELYGAKAGDYANFDQGVAYALINVYNVAEVAALDKVPNVDAMAKKWQGWLLSQKYSGYTIKHIITALNLATQTRLGKYILKEYENQGIVSVQDGRVVY